MIYYTGDTVYVNVISVSGETSSPLAATFDEVLYKDGVIYSDIPVTVSLSDASTGMYSASFAPTEVGDYQLYMKNNVNNVIFVSGIIRVKPDDETVIYVGV